MSIAPIVESLPLLSRIARAALNWTQVEAAQNSSIPKISLARFESLKGALTNTQLGMLLEVYEEAGIVFLQEEGAIGISMKNHIAALSLSQIGDPEHRRSDYKGSR